MTDIEASGVVGVGAAAAAGVTPAMLRFYDRRARQLRAAAQAAALRRLARAPRRGLAALAAALAGIFAPGNSALPR